MFAAYAAWSAREIELQALATLATLAQISTPSAAHFLKSHQLLVQKFAADRDRQRSSFKPFRRQGVVPLLATLTRSPAIGDETAAGFHKLLTIGKEPLAVFAESANPPLKPIPISDAGLRDRLSGH